MSASKLSYHFEYAPIRVEGWWSKLDEADAVVEGRERTVNEPIHGVRIVEVSCGAQHTIALAEDGNVFTWGFGGYGRLGHAANVELLLKVAVVAFINAMLVCGRLMNTTRDLSSISAQAIRLPVVRSASGLADSPTLSKLGR